MTITRTTPIAAAAFGAAMILAGAASAGIAAPGSAAPSLQTLPTAGVQQVFHGGRHRYCRFGRLLPRRVVRHRLRRHGWKRISRLRYRPGRRVFGAGRWHRASGFYVTTATRGFRRHRYHRRYRLTISACTGRVVRAYRLRYRGYGNGF